MRRHLTGRRPTTAERGYGTNHMRERARVKIQVDRGDAWCQQGLPGNGSSGRCTYQTRWIQPGTPWALGHRDDRTAWIGPVHARCNQLDAATRGGKTIAARRHPEHARPWRSRNW